MAEALTDSEKKTLVNHFEDERFVEALLKVVASIRALDEAQSNAPIKDDFYTEAMNSIHAKGGRMAIDRVIKEIGRLSEAAIQQCQVQSNQA